MTRNDLSSAFAKDVFLGEIENQSRFAARAAERLERFNDHFDPIEIWSAIQSILVAAGSVSKILWPSRSKSASRGAMLRELLGVDDSNPLSDRKLRNHFEHYDERIEDWFASRNSAIYVDSNIGPLTAIARSHPSNVHRSYDPATRILTFRGESMSLGAILKALEEIHRKCSSTICL